MSSPRSRSQFTPNATPRPRLAFSLARFSRPLSRLSNRLRPKRPKPSPPYEAGRKSASSISTYSGESYNEYDLISDVDEISAVTDVPTPRPADVFAEEWPDSAPASSHLTTATSQSSVLDSGVDSSPSDMWMGWDELVEEGLQKYKNEMVEGLVVEPSSMQGAGCLLGSRCVSMERTMSGGFMRKVKLVRMQRVASVPSTTESQTFLVPKRGERGKISLEIVGATAVRERSVSGDHKL